MRMKGYVEVHQIVSRSVHGHKTAKDQFKELALEASPLPDPNAQAVAIPGAAFDIDDT